MYVVFTTLCTIAEYAALLSAMLVKPLSLGVAMTAGVLPLSQRGQYSPPPSLLQLWYIEQGKHWYSNQDYMSGFNLEVVQRCKTHVQLIKEFVETVDDPVVVSQHIAMAREHPCTLFEMKY